LNLKRQLGELQQETASGLQASAHAIALDITAAGSVPTLGRAPKELLAGRI
jgi:hypothetical protein